MTSADSSSSNTGRILVSAWAYNKGTLSEGWTAAQLVAGLRQVGRRVTVLTIHSPTKPKWFGVAQVRCRAPIRCAGGWAPNYLEFAVRSVFLTRQIRSRFAVIHQVSPITLRVPTGLGLLGVPFLWGPVGGSISYPPGFERYSSGKALADTLRRLDRARLSADPSMILTLRTADRIATTTSMAQQLIPDRYRDKTVVIPEGMPEHEILEERPPEGSYVMSSGRLVPYKAMDLVIRAFARIRGADSVKLIITGDGPLRHELAALVDRLKLNSRIELRGKVSRSENHALMRGAMFCAFPALREAFGHVYLEAMAAWKPVVATDWGGPRDLVVDGVTGLKVLGRTPDEHVELMGDAMQRLIDDADARRRMGAAAASRVRTEYNWSALAIRYDQLYREISK